jgi:hypothetical protein
MHKSGEGIAPVLAWDQVVGRHRRRVDRHHHQAGGKQHPDHRLADVVRAIADDERPRESQQQHRAKPSLPVVIHEALIGGLGDGSLVFAGFGDRLVTTRHLPAGATVTVTFFGPKVYCALSFEIILLVALRHGILTAWGSRLI